MEESKEPSNPFAQPSEPSEATKVFDEEEVDAEATTPAIAEQMEQMTLENRTVRSTATKLGSFSKNPKE